MNESIILSRVDLTRALENIWALFLVRVGHSDCEASAVARQTGMPGCRDSLESHATFRFTHSAVLCVRASGCSHSRKRNETRGKGDLIPLFVYKYTVQGGLELWECPADAKRNYVRASPTCLVVLFPMMRVRSLLVAATSGQSLFMDPVSCRKT